MKKKAKSNIDLMMELRGTWIINPRTRIHDNNPRKSKKELRNKGKAECRSYIKEYPSKQKRDWNDKDHLFFLLHLAS